MNLIRPEPLLYFCFAAVGIWCLILINVHRVITGIVHESMTTTLGSVKLGISFSRNHLLKLVAFMSWCRSALIDFVLNVNKALGTKPFSDPVWTIINPFPDEILSTTPGWKAPATTFLFCSSGEYRSHPGILFFYLQHVLIQ